MGWPNSSRPASCSAVARRRMPPIASSTRWCGMRPMRAFSRAAGSNCTARSHAHSRRSLLTSWRASRRSWRTTSRQPAWLTPAIDYWLRAGNLALSRSANAEAVKHLRQGIELTRSLAPSPERVRKELDFYLALGPAMAATEGDAAPETLRVFSHARELLGDGGTLTEQMTVLWGAYLAHSMRAEHTAARDVAHQCLALAAHHEHPGMSALANRFMGQTLHFMGAFVEARVHLERTLDLCAANQETIAAYRRFGTDDQVNALSFLASTLLLLGYPEQSATAVGQAVSRAQAMGLAYSTALALSHVAFLGTIGCDPQRAAAYADEAIALSVEHGLASPDHRARFFRGALLAQ